MTDLKAKFQRGDVVSHGIDGPKMIVLSVDKGRNTVGSTIDLAECMWFNKNHELQSANFGIDLLLKLS